MKEERTISVAKDIIAFPMYAESIADYGYSDFPVIKFKNSKLIKKRSCSFMPLLRSGLPLKRKKGRHL